MADLSIVDSEPLPKSDGLSIVDSQPDHKSWTDQLVSAAKNFWGQVNPLVPSDTVSHAIHHPIDTAVAAVKGYGEQNGKILQRAEDSYKAGDYSGAAAHGLHYILNGVPGVGAALDEAGDQAKNGDIGGAVGKTLGLATNLIAGAKAPELAGKLADVMPQYADAIKGRVIPPPATPEGAFAAAHDIPVPASVNSGNKFTSAVESHLANSMGSSGVMAKAADASKEALARTGSEIADQVAPLATPETAGESLQAGAEARQAAIPEAQAAQDAALAQKGQEVAQAVSSTAATPETAGAGTASALQATEKAHGAAANDAYSRLREIENDPANLKQVQVGTKENPELDKLANTLTGKGITDLSPEDAQKVRNVAKNFGVNPDATPVTQDLALPVDMRPVKTSLQPVYDELKRTMPIAQQQASRGLKAIENIINGDDHVSASTADTNLGAVKAIEREAPNDKTTFLARKAIDAFSPAVDAAISGAGTDATDALAQGRALTKAKYATRDTFEQLPTEPVQIYRTLTAPGDANISLLRDVKAKAPQSIPAVGRAMVQGLMDEAQSSGVSRAASAWDKIGDATKLELLGTPDKVAMVDKYFETAKDLGSSPIPAGSIAPGPAVPGEPVRAYSRLVQDKDVAIQALRDAAQTTPEAVPQIARAKLQEIINMATEQGKPGTAASSWQKLGPSTKEILYPDPVMRQQLDDFFSTARKVSEAIDRNTSRTAYVGEAAKTIHVIKDLLSGTASVASAGTYPAVNYALAKILTTPGAAFKLTKAMNLAGKAALTAADTAQIAALTSQALKSAGIDAKQLEAPAASLATDHKVGDTVTLPDIGPVVIKQINPDGTFAY